MRELDEAAQRAFKILGEADIPALIMGGYAMSAYGYRRYTEDIDVVVQDHKKAIQVLKENGYTEGKLWFKLVDPEGLVGIDVLPSGVKMSGNDINNPVAEKVSLMPEFLDLKNLIRTKLGAVVSGRSPVGVPEKNTSDIIELIKRNDLPRGFLGEISQGFAETSEDLIRMEFDSLWDKLHDPSELSKRGEWYDPFEEFLHE